MSNPEKITVIFAKYIITMEEQDKYLTNHALVFSAKSGDILAIVTQEQAKKDYPDAIFFSRNNSILMPGLINSHTHSPMSLLKGYADDLELMDWLQNHIWPAEGKLIAPDFIRDGTELSIAEMIRSGTTCFNDMYFFPNVSAEVCERSGMRALIGAPILMFPTAWASTPAEYLEKGIKLIHDHKQSDLVTISIAPHSPYTTTDEQLIQILKETQSHGLPIHMHIHETKGEVEDALKNTKLRPIERLDKLNIINSSLIAVHMTQLTEDEISLIANKGTSVAHCPESNTKLASGFCPVYKLLEAGVNVCLGTDGSSSNNDLDMFGEMRTAALLGKLESGKATALPAYTVLKMATLNGAKALGLENVIGSLKVGKKADLITIRCDELESVPLFNPISHLVYVLGRENVTDVWVQGNQILHNRSLITLDETTIIEKANSWNQRVAAVKADVEKEKQNPK